MELELIYMDLILLFTSFYFLHILSCHEIILSSIQPNIFNFSLNSFWNNINKIEIKTIEYNIL
jgi:hypothetical protein